MWKRLNLTNFKLVKESPFKNSKKLKWENLHFLSIKWDKNLGQEYLHRIYYRFKIIIWNFRYWSQNSRSLDVENPVFGSPHSRMCHNNLKKIEKYFVFFSIRVVLNRKLRFGLISICFGFFKSKFSLVRYGFSTNSLNLSGHFF